MTRALVALVALTVAGGATGPSSKPAAPPNSAAQAQAAAPAPRSPAPPPPPGTAPTSPAQPGPPHLANFRIGAGMASKILRVLRQGAQLEVLETGHDWLRGRLDDSQEGWVAESVTSATAP